MEKVLVEIYVTYGKGDGDVLLDSFVREDGEELRKSLIDEWGTDISMYGDEDLFIGGDESYISYGRDGGDWDDPTGVDVVISAYSEKKDEIESRYRRDLDALKKQFEVEDE